MRDMEPEVKTLPHRRERAVNRRIQGDIGEMSAMEWLGVQVKTSTFQASLASGDERWKVAIATNGGNRSWTGLTKRFDPARVDRLFVLVGNGRRWFIPARYIEAEREISLGGRKYSEFEIEPGTPFESLIYSNDKPNRILSPTAGECQSGQMDVTVNHTAMPTQVRILPPPSPLTGRQILLRPKRQATFPKAPCEEAGISPGDQLQARADGPGRLVFEKIDGDPPV